jgi:hypothetical protein
VNPTTRAYHAAIARGMCGRCHVVPFLPGKVYCKDCGEHENRRHRARCKALRKRWRCVGCRRMVDKARSRCASCRKKRSAYEKRRRLKRIAAGLCGACGKHPIEAGGRCAICRKRAAKAPSAGRNATRARRQAAGLCIECEEPVVGTRHRRCADCRKTAAEARQAKVDAARDAHECLCGAALPKRGTHTSCEKCRRRRQRREAAKRAG